MAYATLDDVRAAAPKLTINAASRPSEDDGDKIVLAVNAEVDSILRGLGYLTPVTGSESLVILKDIVVQGSLAKILKAMFYGVRNPDEVGANDAWREYRNRLKALVDPEDPFVLPDAPQDQQAGKDTTEVVSDVPSYEAFYGDVNHPTRDQVF